LALMMENDVDVRYFFKEEEQFLKQGKTLLYFAKERTLIGMIAVSDMVKKTSFAAIDELKRRKVRTILLTGDNKVVAEQIGSEIGVDEIIAEVLPQEKEQVIAEQQKNGKKVAFVGDGINDSPALTRADVGIAIGTGTDIAIESADIVLMNGDLRNVVTTIELSEAVIRNIKLNLFWAFFYNVIGIPVAAGVFYWNLGWKLNPMIGAAAMSLSSFCVVINALRLRKFNSRVKGAEEKMITSIMYIDGMMCNHCKMTVEKVLGCLDGVVSVEVELDKKRAVVQTSKLLDKDEIHRAITEAGFTLKSIVD